MNNESPLIPQGSLLEQKDKGRARVKIAVFVVLAIHGLGLLALLMQGCKPSAPAASDTAIVETNATPTFEQPVVEPPTTTAATTDSATTAATPPPYVAPTNEPVPTPLPTVSTPPPPSAGAEYKVAKGESFARIAKKLGTSTRALLEANPGVDPAKLKIGQVIQVPAASATPPPAAGLSAGGAPTEPASTENIYTVKSGDTLIRIANQLGTSPRAIRAANGLKNDKIRVGQKLKVPAKADGAGARGGSQPGGAAPGVPGTTPVGQ
jgi:LysM repeat protein